MRQGNTLIPALAVMLSMAAFVAVLAFALWPKSEEVNPTTGVIRHKATNTTNSVTNVNTNAAVNVNTATNTNAVAKKACDLIDQNLPELTMQLSYCQGDDCGPAKTKADCEKIDVISEDLQTVQADGKPDCRWNADAIATMSPCQPNK